MAQADMQADLRDVAKSTRIIALKVADLIDRIAALRRRVDDLEKKLTPVDLDPNVHLDTHRDVFSPKTP